jgi:ABC-type uncharacterized transport system substrate-binding protein
MKRTSLPLQRREFITLLSGAAAWPLAAQAQKPLPLVGILRINPREFEIFAEPFRRDLKELGWDEGRNIRFEFAWAGGRNEDVPALARDLVTKQPDIIVTFGNLGLSAGHLNLELAIFTARNVDEVGPALDGIATANVGAVNVLASPMLNGARRIIIDRLQNNRLPSIYEWPECADDAGLLGYGAPITSPYRRVAVLVDKILRGAHPADLPIDQPTKFELGVNLRTANAIGLTITPSLLLRADRVIE